MRLLLLAASGLIAGITGHVVWSEAASSRSAVTPSTRAADASEHCALDPQRVRAEVRRAVRDVVHPDTAGALAEAMRTGVILEPEATEETDDNKRARAEERALIEAAVNAGRWTDEDVIKLRALLPRLSAVERPKVFAEVSQAIDQRRFKLEASVRF
jgi:hypothetical protein